MNLLNELSKIKELYSKGGNLMEYIRSLSSSQENSSEGIMISYDFQAGSYIEFIKKNPTYIYNYTIAISNTLNKLGNFGSILEVGVGEATTLGNLIKNSGKADIKIFGFDISWSRIKFGQKYLQSLGIKNANLFIGDLFNSPLLDNSVDVVYTSHSIEPNGGREKEALTELYRVTKNYLILLEPAYELASEEGKKRMEKNGYVKNLYENAKELGYKVIEYRLFDYFSNPLNPTGLIVIEKSPNFSNVVENPLGCPNSKTPLSKIRQSFFSKESLLAYPIVDEVPCLLKENAIIATHYLD